MKFTNAVKTLSAGLGAAALVAVAPLSASAVTIPGYLENNDPAPAAIYTGGTGTFELELDGEGFNPNPFDRAPGAGFYIAFGDEFSHLDASVYYSAIWLHSSDPLDIPDEFVLNTDGSFEGAVIEVTDAFGDTDCKTSPSDTAGVQCYIYTFSAHGSNDRSNDNEIPVYFG